MVFPLFVEKTRPALVKARSLYFSMAACQLYPGRLAIEYRDIKKLVHFASADAAQQVNEIKMSGSFHL